jgi:hypothetical protein
MREFTRRNDANRLGRWLLRGAAPLRFHLLPGPRPVPILVSCAALPGSDEAVTEGVVASVTAKDPELRRDVAAARPEMYAAGMVPRKSPLGECCVCSAQ